MRSILKYKEMVIFSGQCTLVLFCSPPCFSLKSSEYKAMNLVFWWIICKRVVIFFPFYLNVQMNYPHHYLSSISFYSQKRGNEILAMESPGDSLKLLPFCCCCCCLFAFSKAAPEAYGGSQARDCIGAVAASLCQGHSNTGSEPRLQPTPQLTATLDP